MLEGVNSTTTFMPGGFRSAKLVRCFSKTEILDSSTCNKISNNSYLILDAKTSAWDDP